MIESTRCGVGGLLRDVTLLGSCWGIQVSEAGGVSASIWHGQCDRMAPISMGHYYQTQLPGSTLHIDPRAGHITMLL